MAALDLKLSNALKSSRASGVLNLQGKGLTAIPIQVLEPFEHLESDEKAFKVQLLSRLNIADNEVLSFSAPLLAAYNPLLSLSAFSSPSLSLSLCGPVVHPPDFAASRLPEWHWFRAIHISGQGKHDSNDTEDHCRSPRSP